jgi:hypothetical protein
LLLVLSLDVNKASFSVNRKQSALDRSSRRGNPTKSD